MYTLFYYYLFPFLNFFYLKLKYKLNASNHIGWLREKQGVDVFNALKRSPKSFKLFMHWM